MEVVEGSDQKSDIWPHWMAAHARLKNEFMEDEKCHNLMRWLNYIISMPLQDHNSIISLQCDSGEYNSLMVVRCRLKIPSSAFLPHDAEQLFQVTEFSICTEH